MKKRVKRKINLKRIISFIITIIIIYFIVVYISNIKIKNIVILNNSYYTDDDIIYQAGIENYPKFITLNTNKIKNKIKKLELVSDISIEKKFGYILKIDVKEKRILYYDKNECKYKLSDNTYLTTDDNIITPTLINHIPENIEKEFVNSLNKVDNDILKMISEIEYDPTEYDNSRFLLYMNDGNEVFVNNLKMDLLNKYLSIVTTLNNKNGILYLDNGNYFEIKED